MQDEGQSRWMDAEKATLIGVYHGDRLVQVHCEQTSDEQCNTDDARKAGHVRQITWATLVTAAYNGEEIRTELFCEHCFGNIG